MVIQTVSSRVIRQSLAWLGIVPTRVRYRANSPFGRSASASLIELEFERFSANTIGNPGSEVDRREITEFIDEIRQSFCGDISVNGWIYGPVTDILIVAIEHTLAEG